MPEYVALRSTCPKGHGDEETESLLPDAQLPVHKTRNRTTLVWLTILIVMIAISTAAILQIYISKTFGLELIRSPKAVTAAFRMLQPSPNLEKGLTTADRMNLQSG
jgi:hypothetical protein